MSREPLSNIGMVCDAHAPKPRPELVKKAESLVGKFVKKGFATGLPKGEPQVEHMWVDVQRVEGEELVGLLNNDPLVVPLRCGDTVRVKLSEVEDVC